MMTAVTPKDILSGVLRTTLKHQEIYAEKFSVESMEAVRDKLKAMSEEQVSELLMKFKEFDSLDPSMPVLERLRRAQIVKSPSMSEYAATISEADVEEKKRLLAERRGAQNFFYERICLQVGLLMQMANPTWSDEKHETLMGLFNNDLDDMCADIFAAVEKHL